MKPTIRPRLTLDAIYGDGLTLAPLAPPHGRRWLPGDDAILDLATGGPLTIAGAMPMICAARVATPEGLRLLRDAGCEVPGELLRYRDHGDYLRILTALAERGETFALQHVHPPCDLAPARSWVSPATLSFLNNKGNLAQLVDPALLPPRRVVPGERLREELPSAALPVVLKAATEDSTGGGYDVLICRTPGDLPQAAGFFAGCARVVIEDFLPIARNLCLNFAVTAAGDITYLGCAEQVTDAYGKYLGNWLDLESEAPVAAIDHGTRVVRAGFELGYWGCVGLDMAVLDDGRLLIYDLNFRLNGSTPALLLAAEVRKVCRQPVLRLRGLRGKGSYRALLDGAYAAMAKNLLFPLYSYDPGRGGEPPTAPRLVVLQLGGSREDIRAGERELAELGFLV